MATDTIQYVDNALYGHSDFDICLRNSQFGTDSPHRILDRVRTELIRLRDDQKTARLAVSLPPVSAVDPWLFPTISRVTPTLDLQPLIDFVSGYLGDDLKDVSGEEELPPLWIVVESGEIFEGSSEQWAQTFFDNVSREEVEAFCHENGWAVTIEDM